MELPVAKDKGMRLPRKSGAGAFTWLAGRLYLQQHSYQFFWRRRHEHSL